MNSIIRKNSMLVSILYSFFNQLPTLGIYLRIRKEREQGSILPSLYIYREGRGEGERKSLQVDTM